MGSGVGAGTGRAHADKTSKMKTNRITQRRFMTVCYSRESATSNKPSESVVLPSYGEVRQKPHAQTIARMLALNWR